MRIQPVSISDPLADVRATNARALLRKPSSASTASTGKMPAPAVEKTQTEQMQTAPVPAQSAPLPQFPEDEVKVQFDKTANDNILIYQFLDKQSGDVVMQLPSTQVLSIVHEIQAELQKSFAEQSAGEADETVKQRGPGHGN
jgi:uncharacterized FlaG/YvyC family protein